MTDFSSYDEPRDPCCLEEPDHKHYGWPKPDIDTLHGRLTVRETNDLARAALLIMADLGSETTLRNPSDHIAAIHDILDDCAPSDLPTISVQDKPAARWWAKVADVDVHDDDKWTPEEEG